MKFENKKDAQLIDELGGPAKVARLLGFNPKSGVQRVNNWKSRGIPSRVKVTHPDLFMDRRTKAA